jgi:hypothetical protein
MMNLAHFPVSGSKQNPTAEDYAVEALHLRNEGAAASLRRLWGLSARNYDRAKHFQSIARRLSWVPVRAEKNEGRAA